VPGPWEPLPNPPPRALALSDHRPVGLKGGRLATLIENAERLASGSLGQEFAPFGRLGVAGLVLGHFRVRGRQAVGHDEGPGEIFE
jgi:hypothetical protein